MPAAGLKAERVAPLTDVEGSATPDLFSAAECIRMDAPTKSRLETVKNAEPHARDAAQMGGSAGVEIGR